MLMPAGPRFREPSGDGVVVPGRERATGPREDDRPDGWIRVGPSSAWCSSASIGGVIAFITPVG